MRKSKDDFVKECIEVHGDRYSYDNFIYVNNKTKGVIHCNVCGNDFSMIPTNHLNKKQGCPFCFGNKKHTTEEWAKKCQEIYNYDYSETEYINSDTKVKIICHETDECGNEHGEFWINPRKHLYNHQGCPKCSKFAKIEFDEFVRRARIKHGDKFIYNEDEYNGYGKETKIICPIHGEFYQTPYLHLKGHGCNECSKIDSSIKRSITFDEFVERAKKIYGDKFVYHKETYLSFKSKTKITCPIHGDFWQIPNKHLYSKYSCPLCANNETAKRQLLTKDEFIKRSIEVHGLKYDYSQVEYNGNDKNVIIICPKHGEFMQMPHKHWEGHGCPKCNQSHLEREVELMLNKSNVDFIYQATKKNLDFLGMMSFDFYIPNINVAIECQGIQHFEDSGFIKSDKIIERDFHKYNISKENNINLIYYINNCDKDKVTPFYNDKTVFYKITDLKNFIEKYETND